MSEKVLKERAEIQDEVKFFKDLDKIVEQHANPFTQIAFKKYRHRFTTFRNFKIKLDLPYNHFFKEWQNVTGNG